MHEGAVCREIVDIVGAAARDNEIEKVFFCILDHTVEVLTPFGGDPR